MKINRFALLTFTAITTAGIALWTLEPGNAGDDLAAKIGEARAALIFAPPSAVTTSFVMAQATPAPSSAATLDQLIASTDDTKPLDRVSIVKQSMHRAGLGSRAMASLVLRNENDYAVKDIGVRCAFKSRDGHISTERVRTIDQTVSAKSRQALPPTLIGFITVVASDSKCSLVSASRT